MSKSHSVLFLATLAACSDSQEAAQISVPILVDTTGVTSCTNELGWTVELTACQIAIEDLEFTTEGEAHARLGEQLLGLIVPPAHAHAGHLAGGEVIGELLGSFVIDWVHDDGRQLGDGSLLAGQYNGVNFSFDTHEENPIAGHTAFMEGTASKDGNSITFIAHLDLDLSVKMVGGALDLYVDEGSTDSIALQLVTVDPSEGDTLFQMLDFGALDEDDDGNVSINPGDTAHNILRRTLQAHDHHRAIRE